MPDEGRSGNEQHGSDQVQPRGAEHGPEGQQGQKVAVRFVGTAIVPLSVAQELVKATDEIGTTVQFTQYVDVDGWSYRVIAKGRWLHDLEDRQKETKP